MSMVEFGAGLPQREIHELLRLEQVGDGLDPEVVVEAAKPASSPIHHRFTWDDSEAAEKYRLVEARKLIRMYRIEVITPDDVPHAIRGFISVKRPETQDRVYRSAAQVLGDTDLRTQALAEFRAAIRTLEIKYGHLQEYAEFLKESALAHEK